MLRILSAQKSWNAIGAVRQWWQDASCTAGLSESVAGRVRAHQLRALFRLNGLTLTATVLIAFIIARAFAAHEPERVAVWLIAIMYSLAMQVRVQIRFKGHDKPRTASARSIASAERSAACMALIWGAVPFLFFASATPGQKFLLAIVAIGMLFAGSLAYAAIPRASIIFGGLMTFAAALAVMTDFCEPSFLMLILFMVFLSIIYGSVMTLGKQAARHVIDQQIITDAAAEQKRLRDEMRNRETKAHTLAQTTRASRFEPRPPGHR